MNLNIKYTDFIKALTQAELSEPQMDMLKYNYYAPGHNITATELSNKMNFANYNAANLHYGTLGRKICERLGLKKFPDQTVGILVNFDKPLDEWHWIMKPELVKALEDLGWVERSNVYLPEELNPNEKYTEGLAYKVYVNKYERNYQARMTCLKHYGYNCQICGINFGLKYGDFANGYIHVHHTKPLSEIGKEYEVDPIKDLIPICPNCHSIIHLSSPPYTIEEMKRIIKL